MHHLNRDVKRWRDGEKGKGKVWSGGKEKTSFAPKTDMNITTSFIKIIFKSSPFSTHTSLSTATTLPPCQLFLDSFSFFLFLFFYFFLLGIMDNRPIISP